MGTLPLDARQHEEFFLTAAQSLFAVALLLRLRFSVASALVLLAMFLAQLGIAFVFEHDKSRTFGFLTGFAWLYLALAVVLFIGQHKQLLSYLRVALVNPSVAPGQASP
jgi:cation:H+ antiporter